MIYNMPFDNFIMDDYHDFQNPQIDVSFNRQHKNVQEEQNRLHIEMLRVQTNERIKRMSYIWSLTQQELCQFFTKYSLFPTIQYDFYNLLDSKRLKLIKNGNKIYFGQINRKSKEGFGIYMHQEDKIYEGQFYDNNKRGQGIQIYANGNLYVGCFQNNKKHGKGIFYWFNISSSCKNDCQGLQYYEGEWWAGLPNGQGKHIKINGDVYTGTFKNGLKHGQGVQEYANGDYYKGEYLNGLIQGYGEYFWQNGSSYKGDFKQGNRDGYGLWRQQKGQMYQGHYLNDKKNGYGVYVWKNRWFYKGNFQNDIRNGYGELYQANQSLYYRGFWKNGAPIEKQKYEDKQPNLKSNNNFLKYRAQYQQDSKLGYEQTQRDQYAHNYRSYNKDYINNYATMSEFAESNLCKRPQINTFRQNNAKTKRYMSSNRIQSSRNKIRIRQGKIGTSINRPIAQRSATLSFKRI